MNEHDKAREVLGKARLFREAYDGSPGDTEISGLPMIENFGQPRITLDDLSFLLDLASGGAAMLLLPVQAGDESTKAAKDSVARFIYDHRNYHDDREVRCLTPFAEDYEQLTLGELRKAFGSPEAPEPPADYSDDPAMTRRKKR